MCTSLHNANTCSIITSADNQNSLLIYVEGRIGAHVKLSKHHLGKVSVWKQLIVVQPTMFVTCLETNCKGQVDENSAPRMNHRNDDANDTEHQTDETCRSDCSNL